MGILFSYFWHPESWSCLHLFVHVPTNFRGVDWDRKSLQSMRGAIFPIWLPDQLSIRYKHIQMQSYLGEDVLLLCFWGQEDYLIVLPLLIHHGVSLTTPFNIFQLAVEYEDNALFVKVDTDDEYEFAKDMQVHLRWCTFEPTKCSLHSYFYYFFSSIIKESLMLNHSGKRASDALFLQSRPKQRRHTYWGTNSYGYDQKHHWQRAMTADRCLST